MALDMEIVGHGVYTPREVARLIGGTSVEVLRWTRGSGPTPALWDGYYKEIEDTTELSFADLIELRVVKSFRRANISLQAIRFAISFAKEKFDIERPLSSLGFKTDGDEILMEAVEMDGEYVSLSKKRPGQKVFAEIVRQSLQDLEYEGSLVARWRPHVAQGVVLDPHRFFGDPILDKYGISTSTLANELPIYGSVKHLSDIYEIPEKAIRQAIKFEEALDAQQV